MQWRASSRRRLCSWQHLTRMQAGVWAWFSAHAQSRQRTSFFQPREKTAIPTSHRRVCRHRTNSALFVAQGKIKVIRTSESLHLSAFSFARSQDKKIVFDLCGGNPNQYSFLSSSSSMLTDVSESREKRQDKSIRIPSIGMVIKQMSSWEWTVRRERERERERQRVARAN